MIFIISLILTFGFALSAVFIGFGPNVYRLSDKGFMNRAIQNAELEAMHYGDLYLRAGKLDPDDPDKKSTEIIPPNPFTYNLIGPLTDQHTAAAITITSKISVGRDNGVPTITVSADKYEAR